MATPEQPEKAPDFTIQVDSHVEFEDSCVPDDELARLNAAKPPKGPRAPRLASGNSSGASQAEQTGAGDESRPS
jgi:hypothetical protein